MGVAMNGLQDASSQANPSISKYSASGSMLGYLYQVRIALLWAAKQSTLGDFSLSLETLDDVSFTNDKDATVVLQTKHSINAQAMLSDLSTELWKTLRVWMDGYFSGEVSQDAARFLITTANISAGTACSALVANERERNVESAANLLKHAATTSTNTTLKDAFDTFLALPIDQQIKLLSTIYIVGGEPNAVDIEKALKEEIHYVSIQHVDVALQMLEGWWFKRVVYELLNNGQGITRLEFDSQISEIQESLKRDSLPIDGEIDSLMVALSELPEYANRPFYKQVELVGAGSRRIRNAITSYLQAFRQRSAWARDDLLFETDLRSYDHRLVEEWALLREQVCDELGDKPGETELAKAGRAILKWAEDAPIQIRSGVSTPWVCRGSFHMLAEDLKVGWHPDFQARLEAALSPDTTLDFSTDGMT
jgi:DNA-binding transcriptional ArsR family regulator